MNPKLTISICVLLGLACLLSAQQPKTVMPGGGMPVLDLITLSNHIVSLGKQLAPKQAQSLLHILTPLRSKPNLPQDQATKVLADMKHVLTAAQLKGVRAAHPTMIMAQPGQTINIGKPGGVRPVPVVKPGAHVEFMSASTNPFYKPPAKAHTPPSGITAMMDKFFTFLDARSRSK